MSIQDIPSTLVCTGTFALFPLERWQTSLFRRSRLLFSLFLLPRPSHSPRKKARRCRSRPPPNGIPPCRRRQCCVVVIGGGAIVGAVVGTVVPEVVRAAAVAAVVVAAVVVVDVVADGRRPVDIPCAAVVPTRITGVDLESS